MKPTMYEFLHAYMHNLYEGLSNNEITTDSLMIDCAYCPFRAQCEIASEAGCELNCTMFIKSMIQDGADY